MKSLVMISALSLMSHELIAEPTAATVQVSAISYNGSGCPLNSGLLHSWESGELVLHFVDFAATRYDGSSLADSRKNCVLSLDLTVPHGYSYSLSRISVKGYGDLKAGTQAVLNSYYYFQGSSAQAEVTQAISGPYQQDFAFGGDIDLNSKLWSPCNLDRALQLNTSARLSQATNEATDGLVVLDELRVGIQMRKCQ